MTATARRLRAFVGARLVRHAARSERGITMVIFAVALLVLIGFVALGVDSSRIYDERRAAQNAADNAAIAASYASCTGASAATAQAAGQNAATANGFNDADPNITVTIIVGPGSTPGDHQFRATVDTTIGTTFANVIGVGDMSTTTTATARATGCSGSGATAAPGAIFGGGTCPSAGKWSVDVSGSSNKVFGGVHGNDEVSIGGSSNDFYTPGDPDDPFTYVTSVTGTAGDEFQPGYPQQVAARPWPTGWSSSAITGATTGNPGAGTFLKAYYDLAVSNGTYSTSKVSSITKDGVYYTTHTDGFDVGSVSGAVRNVVLVATRGPIKISDSSTTFNPYNHGTLPRSGVLMISNQAYAGDEACDKYVISVSGSSVTWNGIMWGPRGLLEMSGSSNTAINGSLIGHAVRLNGSNITINYNSSLFPAAALPDVLLIH